MSVLSAITARWSLRWLNRTMVYECYTLPSKIFIHLQPSHSPKGAQLFSEGFEFVVDGGKDFSWDLEEAMEMAAKSTVLCYLNLTCSRFSYLSYSLQWLVSVLQENGCYHVIWQLCVIKSSEMFFGKEALQLKSQFLNFWCLWKAAAKYKIAQCRSRHFAWETESRPTTALVVQTCILCMADVEQQNKCLDLHRSDVLFPAHVLLLSLPQCRLT